MENYPCIQSTEVSSIKGAHQANEGGTTGRLHCAQHGALWLISQLSHRGPVSQNLRNYVLPPQLDSISKGQEKLETLGNQGFLGA